MLLTKRPVAAAPGGADFISFVSDHFDCYWLTTHCQGDAVVPIRYLSQFYEPAMVGRLQTWQVTSWNTLKTEGIDLRADFFWLDDAPFASEQQELERHGLLHRLIIVELERPQELAQLQQLLTRIAGLH